MPGLDRAERLLVDKQGYINSCNTAAKIGTVGALIMEVILPALPFEILGLVGALMWLASDVGKSELEGVKEKLKYTKDGRVYCPDCNRAMEECSHGSSIRHLLVRLRRT
jgi:hypothetical protein